MKKYFIVLPILALFILTACGAVKVAIDPYVGAWSTVTEDTPQGDVASTMTITKNTEGVYAGTVVSSVGTFQLENLTIVDGKMSSGFELDGMDFSLNGTFSGDSFSGFVDFDGGQLKITGKKVVEPVK